MRYYIKFLSLNNINNKIILIKQIIEKSNFKRVITDLKYELDLLNIHKRKIEESISMLESEKFDLKLQKKEIFIGIIVFHRAQHTKDIEISKGSHGLCAGLENHLEPDKGSEQDKFSPQERILNKWSCVLFTR